MLCKYFLGVRDRGYKDEMLQSLPSLWIMSHLGSCPSLVNICLVQWCLFKAGRIELDSPKYSACPSEIAKSWLKMQALLVPLKIRDSIHLPRRRPWNRDLDFSRVPLEDGYACLLHCMSEVSLPNHWITQSHYCHECGNTGLRVALRRYLCHHERFVLKQDRRILGVKKSCVLV